MAYWFNCWRGILKSPRSKISPVGGKNYKKTGEVPKSPLTGYHRARFFTKFHFYNLSFLIVIFVVPFEYQGLGYCLADHPTTVRWIWDFNGMYFSISEWSSLFSTKWSHSFTVRYVTGTKRYILNKDGTMNSGVRLVENVPAQQKLSPYAVTGSTHLKIKRQPDRLKRNTYSEQSWFSIQCSGNLLLFFSQKSKAVRSMPLAFFSIWSSDSPFIFFSPIFYDHGQAPLTLGAGLNIGARLKNFFKRFFYFLFMYSWLITPVQ